MGWLSGYNYRKSVTLSRASGAVSNYQMKLLVGESSGATGEDVDCQGLCLSTFNDLRFTTSDGTTLLDYWIESITGTTPNQLATVWIKFDYIGNSATNFYMYYGNPSASAVSNGANTFILFDDFERGASGDIIGGSWTTISGTIQISTEHDVGDLTGFTGTRAIKLIGSSSAQAVGYIAGTLPQDNTFAIRVRCYKPNANGNIQLACAKNEYYATVRINVTEDLMWLNSSSIWIDSGHNAIPDSFENILELRDVDFTAGTYKVYYNDSLIADATSMAKVAGRNDSMIMVRGDTVTGSNGWIDDAIIRNYRATEPAWGAWGTQEENIFTEETLTLTDTSIGIFPYEITSESLTLTDDSSYLHLLDSTSESLTITDIASKGIIITGVTAELATITDVSENIVMVEPVTDALTITDIAESDELIRKRVKFPNLQGKHLSLKFTSATDGSFAIYYLRHKMFKSRELTSDQKHPNTHGSHIGIKLSNSGSDEFILMYVSEKMQLVTT